MKYYSDVLNKLFDNAEDCNKAEEEYKTTQAEKEAKEAVYIEEKKKALAELSEAYGNYLKLRREYRKKYGNYFDWVFEF